MAIPNGVTQSQYEAAKAEGYTDDEISAHVARGAQTKPNGAYYVPASDNSSLDPSAGGGLLWQGKSPSPEWLDRVVAGTGRGMVHTGKSIGNLIGAVPNSAMAEEKAIDTPLMHSIAGTVGNTLGEGAATAPLGFGVGGALAKSGTWLARAIPSMMTQGAAQGALTSDPGERGGGALEGAVAGGILPAAGGAVSKLVNGLKRTPSAQTLLNAGVDLTPGQMNPKGMFNQFEQMGEKYLPSVFHPAREGAEQGFHAAVIQAGAVPGTKISPSADLSDMLRQAQDSYGPLYDSARGFPVSPQIMTSTGSQPASNQLRSIFGQAARMPGTAGTVQKKENAWLQDQLQATVNKARADGGMMSDHLLDLRSDVRARARDASLNTDSASADVAAINKKAADGITAVLNSQLPPEPLNNLSFADSQYGAYKVVEDAVAHAKDNLAGLTPSKLSDAIYRATQTPSYAKGEMGNLGPLRDLAQAGGETFQTVVPPNGMTAALAFPAIAAGATHPLVAGAAGTAATIGAATPLGRRLAQGATSPQKLAQAIKDFATPSGQTGRDALGAAGDVGGAAGISALAPYAPQAATAALPWLNAVMQPAPQH